MSVEDSEIQDTAALPPIRRSGAGRQPLDQLRILHEAVEFIDTQGLAQLTMRRLGSQLGVEAMALYRYVPGREQLLDGVVELLMQELYEDGIDAQRSASWQEYLQSLAHSVRRLATRHPRIFPLIASRPPAAPWLRPPLRSLRWVESFLDGLARFRFTPEASVAVYRAFATFLLGHLLLETGSAAAEELPDAGSALVVSEPEKLASYPRVTSLAYLLAEDGYADEFEESLEDLINRMALLRA